MTELRVYAGAVGNVPSQVYWGLLVVFCVGAGLLLWQKGLREGLRYSAVLLLAEWVAVVLAITVVCRETGAAYRINLIPLSSYFDIAENSYLKEAAAINILNVMLFIPVGLLLGFSQATSERGQVISEKGQVTSERREVISEKGKVISEKGQVTSER